MRGNIQINRHRRLAPDELTRKYHRLRHADCRDDLLDYHDDWDDYWDPESCRTADDYLVLEALEESIGFLLRKPRFGDLLPGAAVTDASGLSARPGEPLPTSPVEARPSHAPEELTEALAAHVDRLLERARSHAFFTSAGELVVTLERVNGGLGGVEAALQRFEDRPGPIIMALLFAPFWVRPLASWTPPSGGDDAAIRSLIAHLFQIYPVPPALERPWLDGGLPSLKWVLWLLLLGQGGTLHRAARRFGWSIGKRFAHHLATAPGDLTPMEATMWAEIGRLGGDRVDFERVRRMPAFAIDPTDGPMEELEDTDDHPAATAWNRDRRLAADATRAFWRETAEWLIRCRDRLDEDACEPILEWAMHQHTESLRYGPAERPRFTWRGREPANTLAAALEYRRQRELPHGDLTWRAHGLDWEHREGEEVWSVRELLSSRALLEETRAMHHCVATYAHRCAQGWSAIFSLSVGAIRRITVELDPVTGRIVQARGACNRAATPEEQTMLARWLAAVPAAGER